MKSSSYMITTIYQRALKIASKYELVIILGPCFAWHQNKKGSTYLTNTAARDYNQTVCHWGS
jgi:hypothetical protein